MVLASELTVAALIESLETGRFYASSGVRLRRITSSPESLLVEVDPEKGVDYTIEFIGTRKSADLTGEPVVDDEGQPIRATRRYGDQVGEVLATSSGPLGRYAFEGDELYVRARVKSSTLHPNPSEPGDVEMAWTQPVALTENVSAPAAE
jgi:hypothetical protein